MDKCSIYLKSLANACRKASVNTDNLDKDTLKKIVYYSVNAAITKDKLTDYNGLMNDLNLLNVIEQSISKLTPAEFMTIFPIDKDYDGHKYDMKDYYSTMEYIESIGMNEVIGDKATEFLWEYQNKKIAIYNVRSLSIISDIRRYQGKLGIMDEWIAKNNINTYTMHKDGQGKEYMMDSKGRTSPVKKARPSYLRLV